MRPARKILRVRARHLPSGGVIYTRLVIGTQSYSGLPWWGVTVWNSPTAAFLTLAEAEGEFERVTEGLLDMPVPPRG
jgi:hypothetical protein